MASKTKRPKRAPVRRKINPAELLAGKGGPKPLALRLHRTIYPRAAVHATAEAFCHLARITVFGEGEYHQVVLEPKGAADDRLSDEFANYALGRAAALR